MHIHQCIHRNTTETDALCIIDCVPIFIAYIIAKTTHQTSTPIAQLFKLGRNESVSRFMSCFGRCKRWQFGNTFTGYFLTHDIVITVLYLTSGNWQGIAGWADECLQAQWGFQWDTGKGWFQDEANSKEATGSEIDEKYVHRFEETIPHCATRQLIKWWMSQCKTSTVEKLLKSDYCRFDYFLHYTWC